MNPPPEHEGTEDDRPDDGPDDRPDDEHGAAASRRPDLPGYRITARLGFDGGTEVYAAEAPDGGAREIAVLARPAVPDDLEGLIARAASVVAASRVRHPALAAVEDAGIAADGRLFVVTAWVSGATLEEALHAHGATGARTALRIALRAAEGLSAAHAAGLVHGELAPARIRVGVPAPGGWEPAVTVTGLGLRLARSTGAAPQKDRRPYVAPEQWTGAGVSPAADVFALASITLAALSGKPPAVVRPLPPGESRTAADEAPASEPHPSVLHVLSRARAADPAQRYPTMTAFADALARASAQIWAPRAQRAAAVAAPAAPAERAAPEVAPAATVGGLAAHVPADLAVQRPPASPADAESGRPAALPHSSAGRGRRRLAAGGAALLAAGLATWAVWASRPAPARAPGAAAPVAVSPREAAPAAVAPRPAVAQAPASIPGSPPRAGGTPQVARSGRVAAADAPSPRAPASGAPVGVRPVRTAREAPATDRGGVAAQRALTADAGEPPAPPTAGAPTPATRALAAAAPRAPAPAVPAPAVPSSADAMRAGVTAALADYTRAIEARDLGALRRAYPGMTAAQQRAWRSFFGSVSDVRTDLAVANLRGDGDDVLADVRGSYEFQNRAPHRAERTPVRFRATVTRGPDGWRLRTVE